MKTLIDLVGNSICIAVLLFVILCSGYLGLMTGDCGLTYVLKDFEFVWLVVGFIYLGPFLILIAVTLVLLNFPSESLTHPLRSLPNFSRSMIVWPLTWIGIASLGFLITAITGSPSQCTVSMGF